MTALVLCPLRASTEPLVLKLSPDKTSLTFTVKATGHAIEGLLALDSGEIRFDPDTGTASGQVTIDLRRAGTGNRLRDREMHASVLETERYPVATFRPSRVIGSLAPVRPVRSGAGRLPQLARGRPFPHPSRPGQGRRRYRLRRDHVRDSLRRLGAAQPEPPLPSRRARRRREPADRSQPTPRREVPMRSAGVANAVCFDASAELVLSIGPGTGRDEWAPPRPSPCARCRRP